MVGFGCTKHTPSNLDNDVENVINRGWSPDKTICIVSGQMWVPGYQDMEVRERRMTGKSNVLRFTRVYIGKGEMNNDEAFCRHILGI